MQLFVRNAGPSSLFFSFDGVESTLHLKRLLQNQHGFPVKEQIFLFNGRPLDDAQPLCTLPSDCTLHLVHRLRGGKGGFGALLRGQGRDGKLTTNYDACRDLNGRRIRLATAEQKLMELTAKAKEKEAERLAQRQLRDEEKAARREQARQVDVDEVRSQQKEVVEKVAESVQSALQSALNATALGKRKFNGQQQEGKRVKGKAIPGLELSDSDLSTSDEE